MSDTAIKVENLSKKYTIGAKASGSLRETIVHKWNSLSNKTNCNNEEFWALKDISFEVKQGEILGIIGKNGAGKSTLLKVLSRITEPTSGRFVINGRVSSLLEVGTGFHPELTGRENIYLNGTILGMTRKEVKQKFDEIVDFSGVEKFIDTPVKHYSSGMYVRLAFAVAAHLEPEILIIDEVLAVGDAEFQKKCLGKMGDVSKKDGRTVLFVSHNLSSVKQLCNHGLLLFNGLLKCNDLIHNVIKTYQNISIKQDYIALNKKKEIYISEAKLLENIENNSNEFYFDQSIYLSFVVISNIIIDYTFLLLIRIMDSNNNVLFSCETSLIKDKKEYVLKLPSESLVKGEYKVNGLIYKPAVAIYDNVEECCNFIILNNNKQFSHLETFDIGKVYFKQCWL
ncbi:MAG: hypothetical protein A2X08_00635 [Bacteroidetes bacterium GWA2_32_17]|nr:MAG: hypothetical protein A2X08_00635 [Bacteroidetes bacterium GWA2_32_17]